MAKQQIPSNAETIRRPGRRWPLLLLLIVASLLIAIAVAYGGRWIYREFVKDEQAETPVEIQGEENLQEGTERSQQSGEGSGASGSTESEQESQDGSDSEPLPDTGG